LLLIETDADGEPTGKAVEVERSTGRVTRTVSVPTPDTPTGFSVYGSSNGVLYMSWRDGPTDSIRWTAVIEDDGQFVVGAEGVSGPLQPDDPTRPRLAVRVTGEGVSVGDQLSWSHLCRMMHQSRGWIGHPITSSRARQSASWR